MTMSNSHYKVKQIPPPPRWSQDSGGGQTYHPRIGAHKIRGRKAIVLQKVCEWEKRPGDRGLGDERPGTTNKKKQQGTQTWIL